MKNQPSKVISYIILFLVGTCIFSYISIKANVSSFTHDESFTYLHFVHNSFIDILSHRHPFSNNHLLNSLFMKYSELAFGCSEFTLRLPNLILLLVYFIYAFLLLRKINAMLLISIFILISTNTTLIDLFGLARGYGLSIGFMLMSLFHLSRSFYFNKSLNLIIFSFSASLAIMSNSTMLYFYVAALLAFNIILFLECRVNKIKFNFSKFNKVNFFMLIAISIYLYEPVRRVFKFNTFDVGGKIGFIEDTVTSLVNMSFQNLTINSFQMIFLQILFICICIIPFLIVIKKYFQRNTNFFSENKTLILIDFIIIIISLETIATNILLNTNFLSGRFSIFLFPLLIINLGFFLNYLLKHNKQVIVITLILITSLLASINFCNNANLYSCSEWSYDMETKNAVKELIRNHQNITLPKLEIKMGANWLFEPTINFYRQIWHLDWLMPVEKREPEPNDFYLYIFKTDLEKLNLNKFETLYSSDNTNTILIKNIIEN